MAEVDETPLFSPGATRGSDSPYFGGPEEAPLFKPSAPPQPASVPKEQYEKMPWGDVLSRAGQQLVPSAARSLAAIPSAIYNYPETGRALKELGLGAAGKLGVYQETDPAARARQEQMIETMVEPFTSVSGFKKTLAEDPYAILTAAATPFGGGLAKAGELVGATSMAGRTLGGLGKAARYAMDPTQAAMGVTGDIAGAGLEKFRQLRDLSTNVPRYSYEKAAEAGALPAGDIGKAAFNDFMSGKGDTVEFSQRARKATEALRSKAMNDWFKSKAAMTDAADRPLPYDKIFEAIANEKAKLPPKDIAFKPDLDAHNALDEISENLQKRIESYRGDHDIHKLIGFDRLKQSLWDFANDESKGRADRNAALAAYHGVKNTIYDAAPDYATLMGQYDAIDDQIRNIQKSLGTGNKTAANAEMAKFVKSQKTPEGRDLISQLAEHDPVLPYMTAGSTLHSGIASGVPGALEKGSMLFHAGNLLTGALRMDPYHALSAAGLAGAQAALQSPSLMGGLSYEAGRLGATTPVKVAKKVPSFIRATQPAATQLIRAKPKIEQDIIGSVTPMEDERPYFPGPDEERTGRATGGRISRGMNAQMLIAAVERAKADGQKATEQILDQPDEHVVHALKIANGSINNG